MSPLDIADAITEEMELPFEDRTIRYIASDEVSPNELVEILDKAIGNSNLKWFIYGYVAYFFIFTIKAAILR